MPRQPGFVLALGVLLGACAPSAQAPTAASSMAPTAPPPSIAAPTTLPSPRATPPVMAGTPLSACFTEGLLSWCGTLPVPENPADPNGRVIRLRVVVVPSATAPALPDPLFALAGGPGGAASVSLGWTATTFRGIHATRDIVLVDQRGTGLSNKLWLPNPPPLDGLSESAARVAVRDWATTAFAELDADAATYTTAVAMDDLDAVRAALGYDRINLFGGSYGATAAQYYIRQHPDRVRAVVLDGATLLDVPVMERIAPNSQRALDLLFARCSADPACAAAYPELSREWRTVLDQLAAAPVDSGVENPFGDRAIVIDRNTFAAVAHGALIESSLSARLPWLIHAAATGQWDVVGRAIATTMQQPDPGILVMSGIIRCSEAWARFDLDETRRLGAGSYYLDAELEMAQGQLLGCPFAPKGIVPADDGAPARGSMPVLFVVGDADPQDPPENIADAQIDFPNSLTVVAAGQGHTVGHLGCMPTLIDAFIDAGSVDGLDVSCVAAMSPPPFQLP